MNPLLRSFPFYSLRVFFSLLFFFFLPSIVFSQKETDKLYFADSVNVRVNNIAIDGEFSLRGLSADFPYPVLSTITVVDRKGNPVLGLADTLNWLRPQDLTQVGIPVSEIWHPIFEYHQDNPGFPPNPDLYSQTPSPLFTEVRETTFLPTTTMLVMDASGSMTEEIADARAGARLFVEQMRSVDRGGVIVFASTIKNFQPITDNKDLLNATIDAAQARGETALYDAIMLAIQETSVESGRRGIIVYTDGKDNASVNTPQTVIDSSQVYNIPVFTIALGDSTNEMNLTRVAEETGGLFFKAASAEEMQVIYLKLAELIQNFYIMAHTSSDPIRNDTWRIVDVSVDVGNIQGRGIGRYFVASIPPPPADLAVQINSVTDSSVVVNGDTLNAVFPGEVYEYQLQLENLGPNTAQNIRLLHFLPDSVTVLNASISPTAVETNLQIWQFDSLASGSQVNITSSVQFAPRVPPELTELVSGLRVTSDSDTTQQNNFAADTVRVRLPQPSLNFDIAVQQVANTDTTVLLAGVPVPAAPRGSTYSYEITMRNLGPAMARNFTLLEVAPDSVAISDFNLLPTSSIQNNYFWQFDSLAPGESIALSFQATVSSLLDEFPFALQNISQVFAAKDTNSVNDSTSTLVYAIPAPGDSEGNDADVSITQTALTDSFSVANGDTTRFARAGETYPYILTVRNEAQVSARRVGVIDVFPDSIQVDNFSVPPEAVAADSAQWFLGYLLPGTTFEIRFDVTVSPNMPVGRNVLTNEARTAASNEDPNLLGNNTTVEDVINLVRPADAAPLIEARPPIVDVGDPVSVRVQVRLPITMWDLWVRLANGEIDSTYADEFIEATQLVPDEWVNVAPQFTNTRLVTSAEEEQVIFELRTRDVLGDFRTAQASVTIKSSNALVLNRNMFVASREDALEINFKLSSNRTARLDVFDISGSHVSKLTEGPFPAGWNTLQWDGNTGNGEKVGSGLYVITLKSGGFNAMKKVMIVR